MDEEQREIEEYRKYKLNRWNREIVGGQKMICRGEHGKNDPCEWEPEPEGNNLTQTA